MLNEKAVLLLAVQHAQKEGWPLEQPLRLYRGMLNNRSVWLVVSNTSNLVAGARIRVDVETGQVVDSAFYDVGEGFHGEFFFPESWSEPAPVRRTLWTRLPGQFLRKLFGRRLN